MEFAFKMAVIIAQWPVGGDQMYGDDPNANPSSGDFDIVTLILWFVLGGWFVVLFYGGFLWMAISETFKNWRARSKAMNARIDRYYADLEAKRIDDWQEALDREREREAKQYRDLSEGVEAQQTNQSDSVQ